MNCNRYYQIVRMSKLPLHRHPVFSSSLINFKQKQAEFVLPVSQSLIIHAVSVSCACIASSHWCLWWCSASVTWVRYRKTPSTGEHTTANQQRSNSNTIQMKNKKKRHIGYIHAHFILHFIILPNKTNKVIKTDVYLC